MARSPSRAANQAFRDPVLVRHGWSVWFHPLLLDQLERLITAARQERRAGATGRRPGPNLKLVAHVWALIRDEIPRNPADPRHRLGNTMGAAHRHWFRAKTGGGRYRLFFRFDSATRTIVLAWINDDASLRTRGSRTDAYAVFRSMLKRGNPPGDWDALLAAASAARVAARAATTWQEGESG